jgi:hypothetical protein
MFADYAELSRRAVQRNPHVLGGAAGDSPEFLGFPLLFTGIVLQSASI